MSTNSALVRSIDVACLLLSIFCVSKIVAGLARKRSRLPLPPGPKGYPIIGNLFDMPHLTTQNWKTFAEWGDKYGGICSAKVFGQTFIILNDDQTVHDLLDVRGVTYSSRPQTVMMERGGFTRFMGMMPYCDEWKEQRKLANQALGSVQAVKRFHPNAEHQSYMFLKRILKDPQDLNNATKASTGAATLSVAYGYTVNEGDDDLLDMTDHITEVFGQALTPGRFLVDTMPFLRHLPKWFPLFGVKHFNEFADEAQVSFDKLVNLPMKFVHDEIACGRHNPCYVSDLLSKPRSESELNRIAITASTFYIAGTDTMKNVVLNYFLAMSIHPNIQKRLHDEMDTVIGRNRLPTLKDRASLPYLQAVLRECFRWLPTVPTGVFRQTSADDVYNGYFIPRNSIVVMNGWKILHDPAMYKDPFSFNPDRFLGPFPEKDPYPYCFGSGRRVCPGMYLADAVVWVYLANAAAGVQIHKAIASDGKEVDPICEQTPGIVSQPLPFQCQITERHDQVSRLVEGALTGVF